VLAREHGGELDPLELVFERGDVTLELGGQIGIGGVLQQLVDGGDVLELSLERVVPVDVGSEASQPLRQLLSPRRVVPERGIRCLGLEVRELRAPTVDVKGTPWRPARARGSSPDVPCTRSSTRQSTGAYRDQR
jgi:hypothetical protein